MPDRTVSFTDAARNFSDLVTRVHYTGESATLVRNGVPVARMVPAGPPVCPAALLAEAWPPAAPPHPRRGTGVRRRRREGPSRPPGRARPVGVVLDTSVLVAAERGDLDMPALLARLGQDPRIGSHAMAGGGAILVQDLPPFVICNGNPATTHGLNSEGLKRRGFTPEAIASLRRAYKALYKEGLTAAAACERIAQMAEESPASAAELRALADFVRTSTRGIVR